MINALFNQPSYIATKVSLDVTALRHEAIASNMANIETPGYKRIDVAPESRFYEYTAECDSLQQLRDLLATQTRFVPASGWRRRQL